MSLKIRLSRAGAKKRPYYRIVIADSRSPRDGRYIERVGTYDPLLPKGSTERVKLVEERIKHWLSRRPADRPRAAVSRRGRHPEARRADEPEQGPARRQAPRARGSQEDRRRGEGQGCRRSKEAAAKAAAEAAAAPPPAEEPAAEPEVQAEQPAAEAEPAAE